METSVEKVLSQKRNYKKHTNEDLVSRILKAIPDNNEAIKLTKLAKKSGCSYLAVVNWLKLIKTIQSEQTVKVETDKDGLILSIRKA